LDVDAVIIFSDILVPLEPMGISVRFEEGEGPHLEWDGNVRALRKITSKDTEFVNEIIREVKRAQDRVPVIGFCGHRGPFLPTRWRAKERRTSKKPNSLCGKEGKNTLSSLGCCRKT